MTTNAHSPLGRCVGFEDGADGFVVHSEECPNNGRSWVQGSSCMDYMTWHGAWPDWARVAGLSVPDDPTVGWPNSPVWWSADGVK